MRGTKHLLRQSRSVRARWNATRRCVSARARWSSKFLAAQTRLWCPAPPPPRRQPRAAETAKGELQGRMRVLIRLRPCDGGFMRHQPRRGNFVEYEKLDEGVTTIEAIMLSKVVLARRSARGGYRGARALDCAAGARGAAAKADLFVYVRAHGSGRTCPTNVGRGPICGRKSVRGSIREGRRREGAGVSKRGFG